MTRSPIVSVDVYPDFSSMTDSTLEALSDQAFDQLEDGPLVEGLFAFYLSLQGELEDRQFAGAGHSPTSDQQQGTRQPVSA